MLYNSIISVESQLAVMPEFAVFWLLFAAMQAQLVARRIPCRSCTRGYGRGG